MSKALLMAIPAMFLFGTAAQAQPTGTIIVESPRKPPHASGGMMGERPDRPWMMKHHRDQMGRKGPDMMTLMMIMADTDGNRTLSLEEVQSVHERMFNYADEDNDGELTKDEIKNFMRGDVDETYLEGDEETTPTTPSEPDEPTSPMPTTPGGQRP